MNRRKFFNFLGAATLGTIIALKLPDTIAPIKLWVEKPKITFTALMEAYRKYCVGNKEPTEIRVHVNTYQDIARSFIANKRTLYTTENGFIKFMAAEIIPANVGLHAKLVDMFGFGDIKEDEISVSGNYYGTIGTFKFI